MQRPEAAPAARTLLDVVRLSTAYLTEHGSASPRLDAELLSAHALQLRRLDLYLQFDRLLDGAELSAIRELIRRRGHGEPVAYITGERGFYGRVFDVSPAVLVPRPETETLVERALKRIRSTGDPAAMRVADLGTGSGCIAVTLAAECPGLQVTATDASSAALAVARHNAARHEVGECVAFVATSWADDLVGAVDLVVSNPPYVTSAELAGADRDVRDHEPAAALDGGVDGLDAYRALLRSIGERVDRGSSVLLEVDPRRAGAVADLLAQAFTGATCTTIPDLAGHARVIEAIVQ